ncbi:hypothetical protein GOBAR_AA33072 [Gossypium barbadense]|uniref:Protein kinase domain-containing protein n=1 Tax=Gossypium barbadense TaxID=3634 RepID=A0A2P5W9A8_GOSBA|nr:hypothetical protein GOBAR_AA33072 [Gossypium barbadense]
MAAGRVDVPRRTDVGNLNWADKNGYDYPSTRRNDGFNLGPRRAPELLLGAKTYSTAVDMWSVGCIMAEMLAKQPLFKGTSEIDQLRKIFDTLGTPNENIWAGFSELPGSKANYSKQRYNLLRKKFPVASFTGSAVLSDAGFDLLNRLLTYDPDKRITADDALKHDWFRELPLPKSKEFLPTFRPKV